MKEPIPHGSLAGVLQATAQAQATLKDRQDFIEKSNLAAQNALGRFEAYKEFNRLRALEDEHLEQQRALHDRQIRAQDLQHQHAQKELSTYDKRLASQLDAQAASTNHANSSAALSWQAYKDLENLKKARYHPLNPPKPKPTPIKTEPTPQALAGAPIKQSPIS